MSSGEDAQALNIIRNGKDLRDKEESQFWDDFISLCTNASGMSELLGVSKDKVVSWPSKIKELLNQLERQTSESPAHRDEKETIPTGDNGAFSTNEDPPESFVR